MELTKLRKQIHSALLDLRNTERFIFGDRFEEAYKKAKDIEQQVAEIWIKDRDISKLKAWSKKILLNGELIGSMSFEQLRERARELGIPKYNRLNKIQLLSTIKKQEKIDGEEEKRAS